MSTNGAHPRVGPTEATIAQLESQVDAQRFLKAGLPPAVTVTLMVGRILARAIDQTVLSMNLWPRRAAGPEAVDLYGLTNMAIGAGAQENTRRLVFRFAHGPLLLIEVAATDLERFAALITAPQPEPAAPAGEKAP